MKNITIDEALKLIQDCSACIIEDNVLVYPCWDDLNSDEDWWLEFLWEDDNNSFSIIFMKDCGEIQFDGTNLFIKDEDGDVNMITLLVPMKG
jgi:hypothetical protein